MFGSIRALLGLISVVGGAAVVIIGLFSYLASVSEVDLFFWVGVFWLLVAGALLLLMVGRRSRPTLAKVKAISWKRRETSATRGSPHIVEIVVWLGLGLTAVLLALMAVMVWTQREYMVGGPREVVALLGYWSFLVYGACVVVAWPEIAAFVREWSKSSRSCPRCGRSVRAGVMECPECKFDFWSVGRTSP